MVIRISFIRSKNVSYVKIDNFGEELQVLKNFILCILEGKYGVFQDILQLITTAPDFYVFKQIS